MLVCLAASPSIDRLFEVERLGAGLIHRPVAFVAVPGGKGLNVARAASALRGDVRVVAMLAGHAGRWIDDALGAEGIARHIAWTEGETRSCLSVSDRGTNQLTEFYEAGPPVDASGWERLAALVDESLAEAGRGPPVTCLTISGSLPDGAPVDGYAALIESARRSGVRCALDASGEALSSALEAGPDVVKINAAEASELVAAPCSTAGEAVAAAREVWRRAGGEGHYAVVTRGLDGVVSVAADGSVWDGRLEAQGSYPVASGDAFLAGLMVALERGDTWQGVLARALGAGAANAELPGAGRLSGQRAARLAALADIVAVVCHRGAV